MRTLTITDPFGNYSGFVFTSIKVDALSLVTEGCTIYELKSNNKALSESIGLNLPVPYVTSMVDLKKLVTSLGLTLKDEESATTLVTGLRFPDTITFSAVTGKVGDTVDLLTKIAYTPNTTEVGNLIGSSVVFKVVPDPETEESIGSIEGTTLTMSSEGTTDLILTTIGKYGQPTIKKATLTITLE